MFVQLVITFMNSVFCRYTKSLSRFNTVIKEVLYFTHAGVLALIRQVVFNTFLHMLFFEPRSQANVLKDPCGTEEWSLSTVHFTF